MINEQFVHDNIEMFPHCDPRVLHSPGKCEYCDAFPIAQALRLAWNIAFSGEPARPCQLDDPAHFHRGKNWEAWPGNQANGGV